MIDPRDRNDPFWRATWEDEAQHVAERTTPARPNPSHAGLIETRIAVHERARRVRQAEAELQLARVAASMLRAVDAGRLTREQAERRIIAVANRPDPETPVLMRLVPWRRTVEILRQVRDEHRRQDVRR